MDIRKLTVRTVSGLVYVGIIVGCILWGLAPLSWMAAVFAVIAVYEFEKITHELNRQTIPVMLLDMAGVVTLVFGHLLFPLAAWVLILLCRMILQLYMRVDTPLADLARSFMSQLYIGLPLGLMILLPVFWHIRVVLAVFLLIWLNDTGAFLVGCTIGRHRLFERISPKKSWEGFFGGLAFDLIASAIFGVYLSGFFHLNAGIVGWLGLGVVVCVFSTWGDLVESMIKRNMHIKDSGNLIPGHGGILDRIDSLLLVMPAVFIYLLVLGGYIG